MAGKQHASACQIRHDRTAHGRFESGCEDRPRHACEFRQSLQSPVTGWVLMRSMHGHGELLVRQGEDLSEAALRVSFKMKTYRLHQDHLRQVLSNQVAAWPRRTQLLSHSLRRPPQLRFICFRVEVDNRRQVLELNIGMIARQLEVPADEKAISAVIDRTDASDKGRRENRFDIDRRQSQVGGHAERPMPQQQEAVPFC